MHMKMDWKRTWFETDKSRFDKAQLTFDLVVLCSLFYIKSFIVWL